MAPEDLFEGANFFFQERGQELKATEGKEISQGTKENKAVYKSLWQNLVASAFEVFLLNKVSFESHSP